MCVGLPVVLGRSVGLLRGHHDVRVLVAAFSFVVRRTALCWIERRASLRAFDSTPSLSPDTFFFCLGVALVCRPLFLAVLAINNEGVPLNT